LIQTDIMIKITSLVLGIILLSSLSISSAENSQTPDWTKKIFIWHGQGQISEDELLNFIKYLEDNRIISKSSLTREKTILKIYQFSEIMFNGGDPVVFRGKLTTESGQAVPGAKILIKNEGPCPNDGIIGDGITDKHGDFWILIIPKVWDESNALVKAHAEFDGNYEYSPSISSTQNFVVHPSHGEKCMN